MANHKGSFAAAANRDLMRAIVEAGQERWFTRAEKIEAAGALHPGGPIVVIESGFASTMAIAEGGQYTLLSVHGPGDLVGECALFSSVSQTHGQTVTGITRGMAWRVPQGRFGQILRSHPQGWEVLSCHLHDRATAAEERICLVANEPASQRLAVFFLQLLAKDGSTPTDGDQTQEVPLPLTQAQLAQFLGVSRETVERVLRKWVRDKTVQTNRLSIIVENVPQLQKIADGWRPFLLPIRSQTRSAPRVRRILYNNSSRPVRRFRSSPRLQTSCRGAASSAVTRARLVDVHRQKEDEALAKPIGKRLFRGTLGVTGTDLTLACPFR